MHRVAGDREAGAGDVVLASGRAASPGTRAATRDWCARPAAPPGPSARRSGTRSSRSPSPARRSSSASGMSSSVAGRPSAARQLGQPDAGVDLVERRIARTAMVAPHRWSPTSLRATCSPHEPRRRSGLRSTPASCFGVEPPEQVEQRRDEPGPAGLVAGAEPGAVVAVEVLVEEDQVAPVRIVLELRRAAVDRPPPIGVAQERAGQPARRSPAPPRTGSCARPTRSGTRP